jgi:hypothetical protein
MPWKRAERVRGGVCVWTEMVGMRVGPVRAVAARACVFVFSPPGAPQPEGWGTRAQRQKRARLPLPPPPRTPPPPPRTSSPRPRIWARGESAAEPGASPPPPPPRRPTHTSMPAPPRAARPSRWGSGRAAARLAGGPFRPGPAPPGGAGTSSELASPTKRPSPRMSRAFGGGSMRAAAAAAGLGWVAGPASPASTASTPPTSFSHSQQSQGGGRRARGRGICEIWVRVPARRAVARREERSAGAASVCASREMKTIQLSETFVPTARPLSRGPPDTPVPVPIGHPRPLARPSGAQCVTKATRSPHPLTTIWTLRPPAPCSLASCPSPSLRPSRPHRNPCPWP